MTTRWTSFCRLLCVAAGLSPAGQALGAAIFGLDAGYPGPAPGPAKVVCREGEIALKTGALALSWTAAKQGLKARAARDQRSGRSLAPAGELFQIVLADGRRYAASTLEAEGGPQSGELAPRAGAARLAARIPGKQVQLALRSADGRLGLLWRAVIHDGANYVRQELEITARRDCAIREIVWLDGPLDGARTAGLVDGSPLAAGDFFLGCEDPHALNAGDGAKVSCRLRRNAPLGKGETIANSFVIGVAPPGQMRRAFLYYLERERAHPYRPFLHYNSWYDIAWDPFALNETNCLEAIRLCGENLVKQRGVVVDAMVFDDGWDNPRTLWQFHGGFPRGFTPLAESCRRYDTRLGVWLSPFGGYGEPKEQRLKFGRAQSYETNANGFSLAGPKYYAAFKRACLAMIRDYGVNHFKFDGIASGMYANGAGADYLLDTEAMRRLMLELRQEAPNLYINLTTGSWPSPFWLRYADSLWRQGDDMGFAGKGSRQQQWLTYRDQETFRNIAGKGPLFPLNALMTQGVAYSRRGRAGDPAFNSAGFKDDVRAFFGSGTSLQELYVQPGRLTAADWDVLAEAARWSRANADVLVDTHWIGGDPGKLAVYGFASWTPRKGIVMLRNPDDRPQEFLFDVQSAFQLPAGAAGKFALRSPWAEDAGKPALPAEAGKPLRLTLKPLEVVVLEAAAGESVAGSAQRYLDAQLQAVCGLERDLDGLADAADAAAARLLAGGNLWLAGEPGMVAELAGRAGGLCGAKVLPAGKSAAALGRDDVVLWSDYGVTPQPGGIWPRLLESGALLVAFAPEEKAILKGPLPERVRRIGVKVPVERSGGEPAGGQRAIRAIVPAVATAQWAFVAELLGAVRRRHRQLAVYLSIHLDPGMRRFKRTDGLLLEPDLRPDPVPRKAYGGRFLAMVRDGLEAIGREEMPRIRQSAAWLAESQAAHGRIFHNLQGHLPPCEAGRPGDADFFSDPKPISLAGADGQRWVREHLRPGDVYLLLGYQENEDAAAAAAHALGARTIFITSQGPGPEQGRDPRHLYVDPHWPRSDACLGLDDYDVKACPLSAILGLSCYYAICGEVDSRR
ncbi:MAG: hypothetical protein ABSG86_23245 [Thermoguttaceae bacterium]|jgi:hypothetical protein